MIELKTFLSNGNLKVGDDTLIFNITAAIDCVADELGLCPVFKECYAKKAEKQYRDVLAYRRLQEEVWDILTAGQFAEEFMKVVDSKRSKNIRFFRFSEAGDFRHQADVFKMCRIAELLKPHDILTYGYTARRDLDLVWLQKVAVVNGSGFMADNEFKAVKEFSGPNPRCPGDCRGCNLCKLKLGKTIEVLKH